MAEKSGVPDDMGEPREDATPPGDQTEPIFEGLAAAPASSSLIPADQKGGYQKVSPVAASLGGGPGTGIHHGTTDWGKEGEFIE